ncbi:MAG: RNA 3'-phosphate cyclase [Betaproteobacteria bacterium]|nr:RNA 3'-phosphate cyclase [Betaproteobacteria bacterium]
MLDIDGSYGTGGGQLVRNAVALAALTGTAMRIRAIRAKRDKPGLAPQHLTAVRAVGEICGARIDGLALRSNEISFDPGPVRGGRFAFDVGTAGSVTLVLQALLPVIIAARRSFRVQVAGGTDVRAAPPLDYLREVLLPLLVRMGADVRLETRRRGYFPRGGGAVEAKAEPGVLQALKLDAPGRLLRIDGLAHIAHLPAHIAERMRASALGRLGARAVPVACNTAVLEGEAAVGQGGALVLWAPCEHAVIGAGCVAERGLRAETLGETVAAELAADLDAGAAVDMHASDQILVYLALTSGTSSFTTRDLTEHARTSMWLIEQFLPVRFAVSRAGALTRISVRPRDQ